MPDDSPKALAEHLNQPASEETKSNLADKLAKMGDNSNNDELFRNSGEIGPEHQNQDGPSRAQNLNPAPLT